MKKILLTVLVLGTTLMATPTIKEICDHATTSAQAKNNLFKALEDKKSSDIIEKLNYEYLSTRVDTETCYYVILKTTDNLDIAALANIEKESKFDLKFFKANYDKGYIPKESFNTLKTMVEDVATLANKKYEDQISYKWK